MFSPDPELLKYVSSLTGEVTDDTGNTRNLVSVNQLRQLKKNTEEGLTECLMILGRLNHMICYLLDIIKYYGIEPVDYLDIPMREDVELGEIDFSSLVEDKKRKKLQKMMDENERERAMQIEELKKKKTDLKKEDPLNLELVINSVINEMVRGNNHES